MSKGNSTESIDSKEKFEEIFRLYYAELCSFANAFLNDKDASEEIVQETFVKLWHNRAGLEIKTSLKSYLYTSIKNKSLNLIKHIKVREEYKRFNKEEIEREESFFSQGVITSELQSKIKDSIEKLPEKRREIFILSRYEGLKYKEIADHLGISIKTVENQMGAAIKFLRNSLQNYLNIYILIIIEMMLNN